jgi:hypothetical protein
LLTALWSWWSWRKSSWTETALDSAPPKALARCGRPAPPTARPAALERLGAPKEAGPRPRDNEVRVAGLDQAIHVGGDDVPPIGRDLLIRRL